MLGGCIDDTCRRDPVTEPGATRPFDSVVEPCPLATTTAPTHWIEIELLDEEDKGVPYEEFMVHLPDGEEVHGYLDKAGLARLDGIAAAGICRVSFPDRDQAVWCPLAATDPATPGSSRSDTE